MFANFHLFLSCCFDFCAVTLFVCIGAASGTITIAPGGYISKISPTGDIYLQGQPSTPFNSSCPCSRLLDQHSFVTCARAGSMTIRCTGAVAANLECIRVRACPFWLIVVT